MHEQGFIKMYRKFIGWEWYTDTNTKSLFVHCLLKANYVDKKWRGEIIKRGTFITSLDKLRLETGLSKQEVRTALKKLISTNEITNKSTNSNRLITVTNYNDYQTINTPNNIPLTPEQHPNNIPLTPTKNVKKKKNVKNDKKVYRAFAHLTLYQDEFDKLLENYKKDQIDNILDRIENYKKNKNYVSLYLTALSWLKSNDEKNNIKPNRQDIKDIKDTYITHIPDSEANNGPFKVGKN